MTLKLGDSPQRLLHSAVSIGARGVVLYFSAALEMAPEFGVHRGHGHFGSLRQSTSLKKVGESVAQNIGHHGFAHEDREDAVDLAACLELKGESILQKDVVALRVCLQGGKWRERCFRQEGHEDVGGEQAVGETILPRLAWEKALAIPPDGNAEGTQLVINPLDQVSIR